MDSGFVDLFNSIEKPCFFVSGFEGLSEFAMSECFSELEVSDSDTLIFPSFRKNDFSLAVEGGSMFNFPDVILFGLLLRRAMNLY